MPGTKHPVHHVDEAKKGGKIDLNTAAAHAQHGIENILNGHTQLFDMVQFPMADGKIGRLFVTSE